MKFEKHGSGYRAIERHATSAVIGWPRIVRQAGGAWQAAFGDRKQEFHALGKAKGWLRAQCRPYFIPAAHWEDEQLAALLLSSFDGDKLAFRAYLDCLEETGVIGTRNERNRLLQDAVRWGLMPRACVADLIPWDSLATDHALLRHTKDFETRRGVCSQQKRGRTYLEVFNNNPYRDPAFREEETRQFRQALALEGLEELGYGTWPSSGYTYVLLIDAGEDRIGWVMVTMKGILGRSLEERRRPTPALA